MPKKLNEEYDRLNDAQKRAVNADRNAVVLAGPGSGKTATLVVKIASLLAEKIIPPSGLACITYNNDAVREFRFRLAELGVRPWRNVFLGTVHSFCLNCIVRPYASLVDPRFRNGIVVAGSTRSNEIFNEAGSAHVPQDQLNWLRPTITRLRRMRSCGENISGFADSDIVVADAYEAKLLASGLIDFEGIILTALQLVRDQPWIREILAARFPWMCIDEYQDLGGPLHSIVMNLATLADVRIFAVGDPDQTIYDFTGANPKYLDDVVSNPSFEAIRLQFNYRSGKQIIGASEAALSPSEPRNYLPNPERADEGEISLIEANGTNADFAQKTSVAVKAALEAGTKPEDIAIFYRATGPLCDRIREQLEGDEIDFIWERDLSFPSSPLIEWLQRSAAWSLSAEHDRERTFSQAFAEFLLFLRAAGQCGTESDVLENRIRLFELLSTPVHPDTPLVIWIAKIEQGFKITELLSNSAELTEDGEAFKDLLKRISPGHAQAASSVHQFASYGKVRGKVVLTTFHASKGRQFDVVVIPGCAEGILPSWRWNRQSHRLEPPGARELSEMRRLFYVGLSRARNSIYLIHSDTSEDRFGNLRSNGVSRFIDEIQVKLQQSSSFGE
jgi:DNA helicase-2/ATP-dependent DNA helicase PcrA